MECPRRDTKSLDKFVTRNIDRGLALHAYRDHVVVEARGFGLAADGRENNAVDEVIRSATIPNRRVRR